MKIEEIIEAVSKGTEIDKTTLLTNKNYHCIYARKIVGHIIVHDFPESIQRYAEMINRTKCTVYQMAKTLDDRMDFDDRTMDLLNNIRMSLGLSCYDLPITETIEDEPPVEEEPIQIGKISLGFRFTEREELMMRKAKALSVKYMSGYGKGAESSVAQFFKRRYIS